MDARSHCAEQTRLMLVMDLVKSVPCSQRVIMIWARASGASTETKGTFWRVAKGVGTATRPDRDGR